jgi:hypothetical protein
VRRDLFSLLGLVLLGCGGGETGTPLALNIYAPGAIAVTDVESFQVAVLKGSGNCDVIATNCLNKWTGYSASALVSISKSDGKQKKALLFDNTFGVAGGDLSISVNGIPPGDNYTIVIEAVGRDHQLLGSSCNYQQHIVAGSNSGGFVAEMQLLNAPVACDPRIP